jgi:hypothetical protein
MRLPTGKDRFWWLLTLSGLLLFATSVLPQRVQEEPFGPSPYDPHLIEMDRAALDEAYRSQLTKLFGVWMADEHHQPQRAIAGANKARRAYIAVMREIEARERKGAP